MESFTHGYVFVAKAPAGCSTSVYLLQQLKATLQAALTVLIRVFY